MKVNHYKTKSGVHAAIKRRGMHLMRYEIEPLVGGGFGAHFFVSNKEDYNTCWERGFSAEISAEISPDSAA
jgi:hypothetical protein